MAIVSTALIVSHHAIGDELKIVVPGGLENVDGNSSGNAANGPDRIRNQILLQSTEFASLPSTHHLISGIVFRPDAQVMGPVEWDFDELEIRFSTIQTNEVSPTYAENIGADEALFSSGSVASDADDTGPMGGPRGFFRANFESRPPTPFYYNPMLGNLLVDIVAAGATATPPFSFDIQETPYTAFLGGLADEPDASFIDASLPVVEFSFAPGPSTLSPGDYNDNGIVDAADYTVWRDNLGAPEGTLPSDTDGGVIGQAQYDTWKEYFGLAGGRVGGLISIRIDQATGEAALINNRPYALEIDYFVLRSDLGDLNTAWEGIDGNTPLGTGWDRAGGSDEFQIIEAYLLEAGQEIPALVQIPVGTVLSGSAGTLENYSLEIGHAGGLLLNGTVELVSSAGSGAASSLGTAVPEAASLAMLLVGMLTIVSQWRGVKSEPQSHKTAVLRF